jgi:hypothetical protein
MRGAHRLSPSLPAFSQIEYEGDEDDFEAQMRMLEDAL